MGTLAAATVSAAPINANGNGTPHCFIRLVTT